ncbi:MAG TPA: nucleoside triphosphate pyrophosphatase [Nitrospira sp.]|nr:nucleoside triphosphate pyrophosphatase [Nitrospira sp.]
MRLVLASTSPRRRELLSLLKIPFEVRSPLCEEVVSPLRTAADLVAEFSAAKAESIAAHEPHALVLASDTLIDCDGVPLGKPQDLAEARSMLKDLAGRAHLVKTAVTAVCLDHGFHATEISTARVWMKPFDARRHRRYVATEDSLGKAGAYSIQGPGAELIERLEGDFTTVVGFPLRVVAQLLGQGGMPVPVDVDALYKTKPYGTWSRFSAD